MESTQNGRYFKQQYQNNAPRYIAILKGEFLSHNEGIEIGISDHRYSTEYNIHTGYIPSMIDMGEGYTNTPITKQEFETIYAKASNYINEKIGFLHNHTS